MTQIAIWEGENVVVLSLVTATDGYAVAPTDVEYIDLKIWRWGDSPDTPVLEDVYGGTEIASIVKAALVTGDPRWTYDTIGYNFEHMIEDPDGALRAGSVYRAEYTLTMTSASGKGPRHVVLDIVPRPLRS